MANHPLFNSVLNPVTAAVDGPKRIEAAPVSSLQPAAVAAAAFFNCGGAPNCGLNSAHESSHRPRPDAAPAGRLSSFARLDPFACDEDAPAFPESGFLKFSACPQGESTR